MRVSLFSLFLLFVALSPRLSFAEDNSVEHLMRGAEAFRTGQFSVALVEFRFAEEQDPSSEAPWYTAATLVKLHRADEALDAFAQAEKRAPAARDVLFDFYEALACYDARLYARTEKLLERIGPQAGPHLVDQANQLRTRLRPVLQQEADASALEWYRAEASRQRSAGRSGVAALYEAEVTAVANRPKALMDAGQASVVKPP